MDRQEPGRWRYRPRLPSLRLLLMLALLLLFATSGDSDLTQLERIQARGSLMMLTVNGASTYYLGAQGETGFEYDLARRFSEYLGVPLEVITLPDIAELVDTLEKGQGDFIAANLSRTVLRQDRLRFGPRYDSVAPVVVYRRGSRRPDNVAELRDGRLALLAGTSYEPLLKSAAPDLSWEVLDDLSIEDLFEMISNEEIDYTIVDSNILELNRRFFPDIRPAFEIDEAQDLAWATLRRDDDTLAQQMREFFQLAEQDGLLADLRQRHYAHLENYEPVGTYTFQRQIRERLPPLRPYFEQAAQDTGLDWRLLAAVGYQESHWNPDAVSRTGVRGVMMLTLRTARQLGIEDRRDPEQSIQGGARYLKRMIERLPDRIQEPDRTWLALAAYNIGFGHLEDARVLTERLGGNPDRWLDVRDHLPLLTQERWYSQTRFGYARGYEPVDFVENIRTFYDILLWMEGRSHPLLAQQNR
ncbi:membrane-bound lytic murein transglycosylase MltF [Wenzhouxiangella marina]|uniref:Membrane-bound lytic murein transglycosylase F n=1 Tax=Wenzhouxiangella marina TaxID=1579979 RepID=A0A0K0XX25_9GAMM|nr:membrane-bound lytic murein transglycosylase MltF [Wenzhouxiangella marina]AKS42239.1 Membrane-bound lytic transglycosylase F [Wenzhouxiangella marina]MBB6085989.1 membrane-bound lytic murein transglycosylase F [Wenzhouxiangella marina]